MIYVRLKLHQVQEKIFLEWFIILFQRFLPPVLYVSGRYPEDMCGSLKMIKKHQQYQGIG